MKTCKNCRFSEWAGADCVECRRRPPHYERGWPLVTDCCWCGEWEQKEEEDV